MEEESGLGCKTRDQPTGRRVKEKMNVMKKKKVDETRISYSSLGAFNSVCTYFSKCFTIHLI